MGNGYPHSTIAQILEDIISQINFNGSSHSNIADILLSILNQTPYDEEPRSVLAELFLKLKAKIEGVPFDPYDKETHSVIAEILVSILNETEYTDVPQSRIAELLLQLKEELEAYTEITVSGSIVSFTTNVSKPLVKLEANIVAAQTGSGDPSPDNVRPISGWDSVSVVRCGKNLFDVTAHEGFVATQTGVTNTQLATGYKTENSAAATRGCELIIKDLPQGNYYISYISKYDDDTSINVFVYKNGSLVGSSSAGLSFSSSGNDTFKLTIFVPANRFVTVNDIQIEVGTTATTYEPYSATTHTASFGQTVYGGEFVAREGEYDKVIPWSNKVDMGSLNWTYSSSSGGYLSASTPNDNKKAIGITNIVCEIYDTSPSATISGMANETIKGVNNNNAIFIKDSAYTDGNAFKQAVTGKYICYELATPSEITLPTKTQLNTLLGANNIYHDCNGDVEVIYLYKGTPET